MYEPDWEREQFLADVRRQLLLDEDERQEVIDELRGHIKDRVAASVAAGMDEGEATQEAISRLGPAGRLARQLSLARLGARQQLLAAVAVGTAILAVGVGAAVFAVAVVAWDIGQALGSLRPGYYLSNESGRLFDVLALAVLAYVVGRFLTPTTAEWAPFAGGRVRLVTMPLGALALAWLVLFFWNGPLDWATAIMMASLPLWWIAASSHVQYPRLHVGGIALILCGFAVVSTVGGLLLGLRQVEQATPELSLAESQAEAQAFWQKLDAWDFGTDVIAAPIPAGIASAIAYAEPRGSRTVVYVNLVVVDLRALDGWHDLRVEAWRLSPDDNSFWVVDRTARAPVATGAARFITGSSIPDGVDVPYLRQLSREGGMLLIGSVTLRPTHETGYAIAVTGLAPDGRRYLLTRPYRRLAWFDGTLLDWFESALAGN